MEDVDNGTKIPDEFGDDVWKWATAETYGWVESKNPDLKRETKVRPPKEDLEAQKRAASTKGGSPPEGDLSEIPEDKRKEIERIRRIGSSITVGKSFANPATTR